MHLKLQRWVRIRFSSPGLSSLPSADLAVDCRGYRYSAGSYRGLCEDRSRNPRKYFDRLRSVRATSSSLQFELLPSVPSTMYTISLPEFSPLHKVRTNASRGWIASPFDMPSTIQQLEGIFFRRT